MSIDDHVGVPTPTPEEYDSRRPACLFEHPECGTCGNSSNACSDCRGYGYLLCSACELHTDEWLRIQHSFPTREARQEWNFRWLGLGLPASVQRAIRSLPGLLRRGGHHGA